MPKNVPFLNFILITDLYEFAKNKTIVSGMAFSNDGRRIATLSIDRKVRIFTFLTGKLIRVFDEALARFTEMQQTKQTSNMEFGRRMANERELEKSDGLYSSNILFDYSGHFILYPTIIGIKLVNIETNRCVKIIGKGDNLRPLFISLFQVRSIAFTVLISDLLKMSFFFLISGSRQKRKIWPVNRTRRL